MILENLNSLENKKNSLKHKDFLKDKRILKK